MNRELFEELVAEAIDELPEEFRVGLDNVDVVVQDCPSKRQLARIGRGMTLLGLYEGVPQIRRTQGYGMVLPDRIVIFQKPIQDKSRSQGEIKAEIGRVVRHEIAHHFGLDEEELRRIESKSRPERKLADEGLSSRQQEEARSQDLASCVPSARQSLSCLLLLRLLPL